jgi:hypothetical protein
MHASGGVLVPAARAHSNRRVAHRNLHKQIVVTVHVSSGATARGVVSVRVAHGEVWDPVGSAYHGDCPAHSSLRRVRVHSLQCSQSVDVQLSCYMDDPTLMPFALSTRSRTELNLEILAVAGMVAASSWQLSRRAAALRVSPLNFLAARLTSASPAHWHPPAGRKCSCS